MGLFSAIRKKLFHKGDEDYGEFKSSVLNEPLPPPPALRESQEEESPFGESFTKEPPFPRGENFPEIRREPLGFEAEPTKEFQREYELLDKLNLIEAQLSAIRSQTETINERLKNLEARLVRRY